MPLVITSRVFVCGACKRVLPKTHEHVRSLCVKCVGRTMPDLPEWNDDVLLDPVKKQPTAKP